MDTVTAKKLETKFPGEGLDRFRQIQELGGFGNVGGQGIEGPITDLDRELDLRGVLDPENHAISPAKKTKIAALANDATPSETKADAKPEAKK